MKHEINYTFDWTSAQWQSEILRRPMDCNPCTKKNKVFQIGHTTKCYQWQDNSCNEVNSINAPKNQESNLLYTFSLYIYIAKRREEAGRDWDFIFFFYFLRPIRTWRRSCGRTDELDPWWFAGLNQARWWVIQPMIGLDFPWLRSLSGHPSK